MHIHIVLHQPEIPQNTGNIARTCAATGASLHLIHPLGFEINDRQLKRAGLDYWPLLDIHHYDSTDEFLREHGAEKIWFFSTKGPRNYTDVRYEGDIWMMFGKETAGLPEELLLDHPDSTVRIPMLPHLRSLNLSNSVAVAVYEALRQNQFEGLQEAGTLTRYAWPEIES
ncbi:MAG: tRNA (uridine(34)/cytosine(34)/5-carboxymethylaminomethyluridine(34)-2'-O)-methyltransferase TrmL [Clostridia bacterium]|nr:tRNA (uridine(34)/cytosine(34)/5-carboxymethylaminomethyluridine(34)-2'-O)-methyltransferase TrmL [Clostridia bacterium]